MFVLAFRRCIPYTISIPTLEADRVKSAGGRQSGAFARGDLGPARPTKPRFVCVCGDRPEDVAAGYWTLWDWGRSCIKCYFRLLTPVNRRHATPLLPKLILRHTIARPPFFLAKKQFTQYERPFRNALV